MSYIGKKTGNPNTDFLEPGGELEYHDLVTVDSGGDVLVGKTSSSFSTEGVEVQSDRVWATRDGGGVLDLNRKTSDGAIAQFYKDGTAVGNISIVSGGIHLGNSASSTYANIRFTDNQVHPCTITGGANDNAIDLGKSTSRYRNLYLSGGVYVGGTGSANYLDDYEEGTFTPTIYGQTTTGTATIGHIEGLYTKIGRMVHFQINLVITAFSGATGELRVGGLPFTNYIGANSRNYNPVSTNCNHSSYDSYNGNIDFSDWYIQPNSTYIRSNNVDSSGDSVFEVRLAGTYTST